MSASHPISDVVETAPWPLNVEATPTRTYDEVAATKIMIMRTEQRLGLKAIAIASGV